MDLLKAVILGIVEGITEFLPISSTGHLIIVNRFVNLTGSFAVMFDIVIQLGAILSVIVYFWDRLWLFGAKKSQEERSQILLTWKKTIVGVLPALLIGGTLGSKVEEKLFNPAVVAGALIAGGIILIFIESRKKSPRITDIAGLGYGTAVAIGFIQCIAMIPGTSRSAATIIGAMLLGLSRSTAAEYSFFLAIPTMAAAATHSVLKHGAVMTFRQAELLAAGLFVSFLVAWAVIAAFMKYIRNNDFKPFGWYRIALGIGVFVLIAFKVLSGKVS
jgi:undecaprenyl-diphosphatase